VRHKYFRPKIILGGLLDHRHHFMRFYIFRRRLIIKLSHDHDYFIYQVWSLKSIRMIMNNKRETLGIFIKWDIWRQSSNLSEKSNNKLHASLRRGFAFAGRMKKKKRLRQNISKSEELWWENLSKFNAKASSIELMVLLMNLTQTVGDGGDFKRLRDRDDQK
jgi:hypothetical protein